MVILKFTELDVIIVDKLMHIILFLMEQVIYEINWKYAKKLSTKQSLNKLNKAKL